MGEPKKQTDAEWQEFYQIIVGRAYKMGYGFEAEDIAQSIIESRLSGDYRNKQLMSHAIIDYARKEFGRAGTYKNNGLKGTSSGYEYMTSETMWESVDKFIDLELVMTHLVPRQRVIIVAYLMGFSQNEMASTLNLSESRISLLLSETLVEIKRWLKNENELRLHRRCSGPF